MFLKRWTSSEVNGTLLRQFLLHCIKQEQLNLVLTSFFLCMALLWLLDNREIQNDEMKSPVLSILNVLFSVTRNYFFYFPFGPLSCFLNWNVNYINTNNFISYPIALMKPIRH